MADNLKVISEEAAILSEQIAELVFTWGLKRIHGKIWTLIALTDEPVDAFFLTKALNISKALVSISVKELLEIGAIFKIGKGHSGSERFKANLDVPSVLLSLIHQRERKLLQGLLVSQAALANVPAEKLDHAGISEMKLVSLQSLISKTLASLDKLPLPRTD